MRLLELAPAWLAFHGGPTRAGLSFRCPCSPTCTERIHVMFDTTPDGVGVPPERGGLRWHRVGDTFDTLTLTPSIDCSRFGHFHGFITGGEVH